MTGLMCSPELSAVVRKRLERRLSLAVLRRASLKRQIAELDAKIRLECAALADMTEGAKRLELECIICNARLFAADAFVFRGEKPLCSKCFQHKKDTVL